MRERTCLLWIAIALAEAACSANTTRVLNPPPLSQVLGSQWTMIPLPNSQITPGSIVQITPTPGPLNKVDIVWLGRLDDCGIPKDILAISSGAVPNLALGTEYSIDAQLGVSLAHVALDASANYQRTSNLTINEASVDSLNFISLYNWMHTASNTASVQRICGSILSRPGIYAVQEAFVISDGTYSIKNSAGAKLVVQPPPSTALAVFSFP